MDVKPEWNLGLLTQDVSKQTFEKLKNKIYGGIKKFVSNWKGRKDYLEDLTALKMALDEYEKLMDDFGDEGGVIGYYAWLRSQKYQADPEVKAEFNQITDWSKKLQNELQFFPLSIMRISKDKQKMFLSSALLKPYKHFLERSFREGEYALSDEVEKVLNLKSNVSYSNWKNMVSEFLSKEEREIRIKGKKEKKNYSEINSLLSDPVKKTRDEAAKAFNDILLKNVDVAEAEMNSILADRKINDDLRKTSRPDLMRHINDDVESKTVDTLIKAVTERFDLAQRYYKLKAKLMGVSKLAYHERNLPYGQLDKDYSFDESCNLVNSTFENLDKRFSQYFKDFLRNGQVDAFPEKGKRSGAFCVWWGKSFPVYVMLNHTGKITDVSTIAHEFGHAINAELSKKQNSLQFNTPTSTSEVASTFMEDFILKKLEAEADDELKLALVMAKLNDDVVTIFRQVACYNLEMELHKTFREKGYISKEEIGKIFQKHMSAYMGPAVEQSVGSENWWISWPHIRNFFYVYSYASGLLISKALQRKVKEKPSFIEDIKEFLATGSSASPKSIFAKMNIDIDSKDFWNSGLNEVEETLNNVEKLARKLGKIN
jgi:oligoendopeptidase F